ncbi:MAG TPA: SpoIIE family protein phosphatase [Thermoanaerobaculia bacterium]
MSTLRTRLSSNAPWMVLEIDHASAAVEARSFASKIASRLGLGEQLSANAAIIINELTTNILKHATGGSLLIHGGGEDLDICATDSGPGAADMSAWMRDGFSSAGTSGTGLGAVRRLASQFDVHSVPRRGTVVFARLSAPRDVATPGATPAVDLSRAGAAWRPMNLDDLCGDACGVFEKGDEIVCVVADGLGHGVAAGEASRTAVATIAQAGLVEPVRLLERAHVALKPTRGAAVAVAVIRPRDRELRFAGIGNISASIKTGSDSKSLVSVSGIVGHQVRAYQEFRYEWQPDSMLIMHSDGLTSRWTFDQLGGLATRHPATIAAALGRDFARERDDRCVLVVREERA